MINKGKKMLQFNVEKIKQIGDEHYFKVTAACSSKSKVHYSHQKNVVDIVVNEYDLKGFDFIPDKSDGSLSKYENKGIYVFKKKAVDILKNNVKINETKIEADVLVKKEQKEEASSLSKSLPYGLKKTETKPKPKRKRATRKKKTEE